MKQSLLFLALTLSLSSCLYGTYPGGGSPSGGNYPDNGGNYPGNTPDDSYPGRGGQSQPDGPSRSADKGVTVRGIELTRNYTVLYLTFTDKSQPKYDRDGKRVSTSLISFKNSANLVAANGARVFRFIKAEGIPVPTAQDPQQRGTYPGEKIDFVVYFERLDKGLENFDLFECNDTDQFVCWNIYNLYVRNPADEVTYTPEPTPPVPAPTPYPAPTSTPGPAKTLPKPTKPAPTRPRNQPLPPSEAGGETAPAPKPAPAPEVKLLNVSGTVTDVKNKRPVSAIIHYQLSSSKRSVDSVQSFVSTGGYRMTLARGQVYTYIASARGYLATNGVLDLSKTTQSVTRDIALTPLSVGDKITLKNIYFELSKSDLLAASFAELDKLVTMMDESPNMSIRLEGHTDIIGDPAKNLQLSKDRVAACRAYLIRQGIAETRIQATGYGDTRPITTVGTDEDRKVNRRVEFVVLSL
jgi:OmpA-OmpF porin, OOP family